MSIRWKPGFWFKSKDENTNKYIHFDSYRELKKKLKDYLQNSREDTIHVSRSRRGEWGEWFENWILSGDKPRKIKEGWM
jgi:hypothetical protein